MLYSDFSLDIEWGAAFYFPKIQQSVANKYESSGCYQPLLKNKC